jgi:myo-inositol 2-dehydrogenase/D-chiro-inositol 1-dehydrogenase
MNMSHEIDRLRYATGLEVVTVKGESGNFRSPEVEVEDFVTGLFRYDNGAIGMVAAGSNTLGNGPHEPSRVFGTQGQIILWNPIKVFTTREDTEFKPNEWNEVQTDNMENNYIPYTHEFVQAVCEDREPPITGEDGFRVLDIVLGMYDSSEKQEVVHMDLSSYK